MPQFVASKCVLKALGAGYLLPAQGLDEGGGELVAAIAVPQLAVLTVPK